VGLTAYIKTYADPAASLQGTFDVCVIMPTILRPEMGQAIRSIFAQRFRGRIQILIGVDKPVGDLSLLDEICRDRPPNCVVQIIYIGYSTSARHGGLGRASDGGVLRCVLSYLANSPYLAYLDDDNWWRPDHLRLLRQRLAEADWAYSWRWFVHPLSRRPICLDRWESVGPGIGLFQEKFGGFVDPNCLMLNKFKCASVLANWNLPLSEDAFGKSADRTVFSALNHGFKGAGTNQPTSFYTLDPRDELHDTRMNFFGDLYERAGAMDGPGLHAA
jgi:hypothetical protein